MLRSIAFLLFVFVIIFADQASKWYVMEHVARPEAQKIIENPAERNVLPPPAFVDWYMADVQLVDPVRIEVMPVFNIVSVWNKGVSFGMFNKLYDKGPIILVGLSVLISLFFLVWLFKAQDGFQAMGIILVIGGAMGNVIDRLRFGAVFDFLDFHAFDYHWPAFNIADSGIVLGVAVLILHSFLFEQHKGSTDAK